MTGTGDRPRFYLDEDVPHGAAEVADGLGLDLTAAKDAQRALPQDDAAHLNAAAADDRIMVTYNRDDFIMATRAAFATGLPHKGLVVLTRKLPRDPVRIAHVLERWARERRECGAWPIQSYEIEFLSG